jgi:hypothetical protein
MALTELVRTPSSVGTGQGKTASLSMWVKRTQPGTQHNLYFATSPILYVYFGSNDKLRVGNNSVDYLSTNALFRDPSAWYHIVVMFDTSNGAAANRVRLFVNGAEQTYSATNYPAQHTDVGVAQNTLAYIGRDTEPGGMYFNGYLAEINLIDGQALDASSFGQIDAQTGQWIPKAYSGTYGINGFYLKFADNSATTSTTLGKDSAALSGAHTSANNWTPSGFATYDQVLDSPTNNFCTFNPIDKHSNISLVISNGALTASNTALSHYGCRGTFGLPINGKWYWESYCTNISTPVASVGIATQNSPLSAYPGSDVNTIAYYLYDGTAGSFHSLGSQAFGGLTYPAGGIIQCAFDADAGKLWMGINNTWWNSIGGTTGNPATDLNATASGISVATGWFPYTELTQNGGSSTPTANFNFGQGGQTGLVYDATSGGRFKYTPPAGFKALCTANLPVPTIKKANQHFDIALATGATLQTAINSLAFTPDFKWAKNRTSSASHILVDTVRGAYQLATDSVPNIESAFSGYGGSDNYAAWCWKGGGAAITNNDGTVTTTVSANQTAGFSVFKATTPASGTFTLGHGLGAAPAFVMLRVRDYNTWWAAWHKALPASQGLENGFSTGTPSTDNNLFNSVAPTTSVITQTSAWYGGSRNAIFYVWAEVAGFSKFGSYTGNGSADGPFVYCGFKPRWVMIKPAVNGSGTAAQNSWIIWDSARDTYNYMGSEICPDLSVAEYGRIERVDFLSNGFKIRTSGPNVNYSGATIVFAAFAEAPFKYATAR